MKRLLIILLACDLGLLLMACESEAEREREAGRIVQAKSVVAPDGSIHLSPEQIQANRIQTAPVVEQELASTVTATGRVTARSGGEAQVFSPFAGHIIADPKRLPRIGSVVRRGQVVAEVEQLVTASEKVEYGTSIAQLQATIDQTQQEVEFRRIELERASRLYASGAIALKQVQAAEFNLKQAQARLAGTRHTKAQYEAAVSQQNAGPRRAPVTAPLTGIITAANLVAGQITDPSKSLLTIVNLSTVWVEVPIHESNLQAVQSAQHAEIGTTANPGRTYAGSLINVGNVVDSINRTVPVTFTVDNSDGSLKIGMIAEAHIPIGQSARALLIPSSAVLFEEAQAIVYVESEPNVYRRHLVATGDRRGDDVVVISGLNAGEKVVSVGAAALRSETFKGQIPTGEEGEKR